MLNKRMFVLLAGAPGAWDAEVESRVASGESLVKVQVDQHNRGRRSARLIKGPKGFCVRFDSSLDGFQAITKWFDARGDAVAFGIKWADEAPLFREFYVKRGE